MFWITQILLVISAALGLGSAAAAAITSNYTEISDCEHNQVCLYDYTVYQQYFGQDASQGVEISTNVEVVCHSVGEYNMTRATQYCLTLNDTKMDGSIFNNLTDKDKKHQKDSLNSLLSGWFCFIQTDDGKVPAVYHASEENQEAVGFKKSIAAAFQANFKGTEVEEEVDPQSDHISHYKFEEEKDGIKKMHRSVNSDDVIEYTTGAKKSDLQLTKEEDIEYRDGTLYHSAGNTSVMVKRSRVEEATGENKSLSDAFSARGSYHLDLKRCYIQSNEEKGRRRRSLNYNMDYDTKEEDLRGAFNKSDYMKKKLIELRNSMPSVSEILRELNEAPKNLKLFDYLMTVLELENKYGTPQGFSPALSDVLNYLKKIQHSQIPTDIQMSENIYTMLSNEGSKQSQMILLGILKHMTDARERNAIIIQISMIKNAHQEFVTALQQLIDLDHLGDSTEADALLLAFGALASNAQPQVEHNIASFLIETEKMHTDTNNNTSRLVHILLAMGNTGSNKVVPSILKYIEHFAKEVQLASIRALTKFTHLETVRNRLKEALDNFPEEDVVIAITHTLIKGHTYSEELEIAVHTIASHPVLQSLLIAATNFNNTDLIHVIVNFVREVGSDEVMVSLIYQSHSHIKRSTTDWDSNRKSEYNLVASLSSRQSDVTDYPLHKAYLYGKKIGIDEANLKAAAGAFIGINDDYSKMKAYAKAYAEINVLSRQRTLAEIELMFKKTGTTLNSKVYVETGGRVLINRERDASLCRNESESLINRQYRLFGFTYSVWIYVGTIDLSVSVYFELDGSVNGQACIGNSLNDPINFDAGITPQVGLSIEGSASVTLLWTVKVGISVSVTYGYAVEPRVTGKVCAVGQYQTCAGVYNSWPGNTLEIYAWYQIRDVVVWCETSWWISYPCDLEWGPKYRWDDFSWEWSLGSGERSAIYEICYPSASATTCSASPIQ